MSQAKDVYHICLAGSKVTSDSELIQSLRPKYLLTLIERVGDLEGSDLLQGIDLLVVDCSRDAAAAIELLPRLKQQFPRLCMLLVDGGLSQKQIAAAFQDGVKDYFATPYDLDLLVERMGSLCAKPAVKPESV